MTYQVILENKAKKELRRIDKVGLGKIIKILKTLSQEPCPPQSTRLVGTLNDYRLRYGSYRILYTIDDQNKIVIVYRVRHRKDAYKH